VRFSPLKNDDAGERPSLDETPWLQQASRFYSWLWIDQGNEETLCGLGYKRIADFFPTGTVFGIDRAQTRLIQVTDNNGGSFFIKTYSRKLGRYFMRESKAVGEAKNIELLPKLGVKSVNLVGVGELRDMGVLKGALVITKELSPHVPLHKWIYAHWPSIDEKWRVGLIRSIADVYVKMNSQGYYDRDTGLKNFLYDPNRPDELFKIDSPKGVLGAGGKLKWRRAVADVARPWRDLRSLAGQEYAEMLLVEYARKMDVDLLKLRAAVKGRIIKLSFKRARETIKRIRRKTIKEGAWYDPPLCGSQLSIADFTKDEYLEGRMVTQHSSRQTFIGMHAGLTWYLKRILKKYIKDNLRWSLFWRIPMNKALAELGMLELFRANGLNVPNVMAYSNSYDTGGTWLAVEKTANAETFDEIMVSEGARLPGARKLFIKAAASTVAEMHDLGLSQPDLLMKHLLVKRENNRYIVYIIDLQRSWRSTGRSRGREIKELARLFDDSFKGGGISNSDRLRFLLYYCKLDRLNGDAREIIRAILKKAKRANSERSS